MEVKRICKWCGKPFIAKKTTTNYCSHQCASQGYKHRMRERRLELRELQDLIEVKSKLDHQDYFTFAQAAQLMGVSRQYIYKLVKEDKLRASRISARMSIIRRADIELMLKTRPYERRRVKDDLDITEYYTAEQISEKYKVSQNGFGHIQERTISPKSVSASSTIIAKTYRCCLCQIRGGFRPDRMVHPGRNSGEVRHDTCRHSFASV